MPLNDTRPGRDDSYQNLQFLRRDITIGDGGKTIRVGALPAGAVILKSLSGANVDTAFNAGTANTIDIGTKATGNQFGNGVSLTSLGPVALNQAVSQYVPADTEIYATVNLTGTAATTGTAQIIIAYVTKN